MIQLVLVRGLPGSGKSTIAKAMAGFVHLEADMFHVVDGEYKFDKNNQRKAHEWCQRETFIALQQGKNVVVSNTFTQKWELKFYEDAAKVIGASLSIIHAQGRFNNVHNVPPEVIEAMTKRWEE